MIPNLHRYFVTCWLIAGAVWLVCAANAKPAERKQSTSSRLIQGLFFAASLILLSVGKLQFTPLGLRILPHTKAIAYAGLAMTAAGVAFAIWARLHLGGNWSGTVTVKVDHKLIRTGPYSIVRNPIYSGFLLALLGTCMAYGELRSLLAFVAAFVGLLLKIRLEEQFMQQRFGEEYSQYKREVKGIIPFVW